MVAPLVEALMLRALRRRPGEAPVRPTRLVSAWHELDSLGYVADRTSVLVQRPGSGLEVLPAGSLVLPALLGRSAPTYAVVTHDSVDVWLRLGPFETLEGRSVQQVELRLTVTLADSPSGLRELADEAAGGPAGPDAPSRTELPDLAEAVLDRLARQVSTRTSHAIRGRTLDELTSLSLAVLLDGALPTTFLNGMVGRTDLEVVDVDWPTEGRGWPRPLNPVPGGAAGAPGRVPG